MADDGLLGPKVDTHVESLGELADHCTVNWNFDFISLIAIVLIDDRIGSAALAVDVFSHITSVGMTFVAKLSISFPDVVGVGASWAV
jgi:hypothetical protein